MENQKDYHSHELITNLEVESKHLQSLLVEILNQATKAL